MPSLPFIVSLPLRTVGNVVTGVPGERIVDACVAVPIEPDRTGRRGRDSFRASITVSVANDRAQQEPRLIARQMFAIDHRA